MAKRGTCGICGKQGLVTTDKYDKPLFHKRLKKHFFHVVLCKQCRKEALGND